MIIRLLFCTVFAMLSCSGCGLIYKQNIQQGNAIEQDDLDELYEGMSKRQVLFVLGTPSVMDPFTQDRWDYVQTFSRRGGNMVQRKVTLYFKDDLLTEISGREAPFSATIDETPGDSNEVATFTKKTKPEQGAGSEPEPEPESEPGLEPDSVPDLDSDPMDKSIDAAEEEILDSDPDIKAIKERTSEDYEFREEMESLEQTPDDGMPGPDIDG
jgi:outer membrane protein assembly factor BamE